MEQASPHYRSYWPAILISKQIYAAVRPSFILLTVELAEELEATLREFTEAPSIEVRENGGRVVPFAGLSWEVRGTPEKPLLHLWSVHHNFTRRVLAILDHSEDRLALAVERFGRVKPDRLEFIRTDFEPSARSLSREEFCERFARILHQQFPDDTLESLTISQDLEHSLSGSYARGILRRGSTHWAVLGVPDGEPPDAAEKSLTFSLLWLDCVCQSGRRRVAGLRLVVPKGASRTVAHRFQALESKLALELYERDPERETLERIDPRSGGNLDTWIVPHREAQMLLDRARSALGPIIALAPKAISIHPVVPSRTVALSFRGLPFAQWDDGRVFFGIGDSREELESAASHESLKTLLSNLEIRRQPFASDTRHTFYRSQPERWLESLVREDVTRIDASLDARFAYSQVFANNGGEHGILDVLTLTRRGRIAIVELKAAEHIHAPLQVADYWLRTRRHMQQGDFARYGYFTGAELQPTAPLVYLVAPALRFHPATDVLLRYLSPEIEVIRVGLAESWRRGLRVVMRH